MKRNRFTYNGPTSILVITLINIAMTIALVLVLISVVSLSLLPNDDPLAHSGIFSFGIFLISSITSSFLLSYFTEMPPICALLSGLSSSALLLSLSAFIEKENTQWPVLAVTLYILIPLLSYAASLLSFKFKENRKPKFKRRSSYR